MSQNNLKSCVFTAPSSLADDEESNRSLDFRSESDSDEDNFVDAFDNLEFGTTILSRQHSVAYRGPATSRRNSLTDENTENESSYAGESDESSSECVSGSGLTFHKHGTAVPTRYHTAERVNSSRGLSRKNSEEKAAKVQRAPPHITDDDKVQDKANGIGSQGLDFDKAAEKLEQHKFDALNPQRKVEEKKTPLKLELLPKLPWEIECEKARKKKLKEDLKKCPWGSAWSIGGPEPIGFVDPNAFGYFGLPEANRSSVLFPTGEVLTEEEISAREERKKEDLKIKASLSAAQYHRDMIFATAKLQVRAKSKKDKGKLILLPTNSSPVQNEPKVEIDLPQHPNRKPPSRKPVAVSNSVSNIHKPVQSAAVPMPAPLSSPKLATINPAETKSTPVPPIAQRNLVSTKSPRSIPLPLFKPGAGRFQNSYGKLTTANSSLPLETEQYKVSEQRTPDRLISLAESVATEPALPNVGDNLNQPKQGGLISQSSKAIAASIGNASPKPTPDKSGAQQSLEGIRKAKNSMESLLGSKRQQQQYEVPTVIAAREESLPSSLNNALSTSSALPPSRQQPPSTFADEQTFPQNYKFSAATNNPSDSTNSGRNSLSRSTLLASLSSLYNSNVISATRAEQTAARRPGWENPDLLAENFKRKKMASMSVPSPLNFFCSKNADFIDDNLLKHFAIIQAARDFKQTDLYKVAPPEEYVPTYEEALVDGPLPIAGNRTIKITNLPAAYSLSYVSDTLLRGAIGPIQFLHLDKAHKALYVVFLDVQATISFMQSVQDQGGLIDIGEKWWVQPQYFPLFDIPQVDLYRYAKAYKASRVVVIGNIRIVQLVRLLERLSTGWHLSKLTFEERCDKPSEILKYIGKEFGIVEKCLWLEKQNIGAIVLTSMMAAFDMYNFLSEVEQSTSILKDAYINFGVDPACSPRKKDTPFTYPDGRVPGIVTVSDLDRKVQVKADRAKIASGTR